jgi:hypothetical protein
MSLSNLLDHEAIDAVIAAHPNLYVALSTADPTKDGSGIAEPGDAAYVRQPIGAYTITGGALTNNETIQFPVSTEDQGTLTFAALFDAEIAGVFLGSGAITPTTCPAYTIVAIAPSAVLLSMD